MVRYAKTPFGEANWLNEQEGSRRHQRLVASNALLLGGGKVQGYGVSAEVRTDRPSISRQICLLLRAPNTITAPLPTPPPKQGLQLPTNKYP